MEIIERHTPDVRRMSIDEASLNLAGTPDLKRLGPEGVGRVVKAAIREEIGECVTASVGVSTSIWMAKQASNVDKRDGLQRIDHTNLVSVFERLQLTDLSGIAEATASRLARAGILSPVQFLRATPPRLRLAGMHSEVARGWSMRLRGFEVGGFETTKRKSYSHSHVLARATASQGDLEELLMRLSDMVGRRLRAAARRGRVVSVGVVYRPDAGHFSKQAKQPDPISTGDEIYRAALALLGARDPRRTVGTLGVCLSDLARPILGENPESESLEDARRWVTVYSYLVKLEEELLDILAGAIPKMPSAAQREAEQTNLPVLASQVERFRHRLDYWVKRRTDLEQR